MDIEAEPYLKPEKFYYDESHFTTLKVNDEVWTDFGYAIIEDLQGGEDLKEIYIMNEKKIEEHKQKLIEEAKQKQIQEQKEIALENEKKLQELQDSIKKEQEIIVEKMKQEKIQQEEKEKQEKIQKEEKEKQEKSEKNENKDEQKQNENEKEKNSQKKDDKKEEQIEENKKINKIQKLIDYNQKNSEQLNEKKQKEQEKEQEKDIKSPIKIEEQQQDEKLKEQMIKENQQLLEKEQQLIEQQEKLQQEKEKLLKQKEQLLKEKEIQEKEQQEKEKQEKLQKEKEEKEEKEKQQKAKQEIHDKFIQYTTEEYKQKYLKQIIKLNLKGCDKTNLFISAQNIKKSISISVKTFFDKRPKYILKNININSKISQIKTYIIKMMEQDSSTFDKMRIIYPMGKINTLQDDKTLAQQNIPQNAGLIFLFSVLFHWDSKMKGEDLQLSNRNLTIKKDQESPQSIILGNLPFNSGKCYFEVKIENFTTDLDDVDDFLIGVTKKDKIDIHKAYNEMKPGCIWAYIPLRQEKIGPDLAYQPFGFRCKKNDVIGVLLEFKGGQGHLNFYKNKERCNNPAFSGLTGTFYPVLCFPFGQFQITLDPKASLPTNI